MANSAPGQFHNEFRTLPSCPQRFDANQGDFEDSAGSPDAIRPLTSSAGKAKRILVVDDGDVVRQVVRAFLEMSGYVVCGEAADGAEAVTRARESRPDLIIMDLAMPRMNGIEASSLIRNTTPEIPIIAFTMYDTLAQSLKSSLAISSVVSKPEGLAKLGSCIQNLLGPAS